MRVRTAVTRSFRKQVLVRGSILAISGATLLMWAGMQLPEPVLARWGWLLFISAVSLIACGLLPYRRILRLADFPNELQLDERALSYFIQGELQWTLPLDSIVSHAHEEKGNTYGIVIRSADQGHFFLPLFTQRAYHQLFDVDA